MVPSDKTNSEMPKNYEYFVAGCAFDIAPTLVHIALLSYSETEAKPIPECMPFRGEWGENESVSFMEDSMHPLPCGIKIIYLSIIEQKFYLVNEPLPNKEILKLWNQSNSSSDEFMFNKIIIGMSPYGGVAVWVSGYEKEVLISWIHGQEIPVGINQFLPENPTISLSELCNFYINNDPLVKQNLETNGLPPRDLFDNYMKQFTYRYLPLFEHWDEDEEKWQPYTEEEQETQPELDYIEEALYDGTHDKLHDGGLMQYHEAGKPKKLTIKWHIKKSEYMAYFWFEDEAIRAIFDRFYGIHLETKTDFIIHIDPEKKKYQLSLFRYGLQEPRIIPEDAYQLIVFKNKFEHFRSENYDQPRGAWIW